MHLDTTPEVIRMLSRRSALPLLSLVSLVLALVSVPGRGAAAEAAAAAPSPPTATLSYPHLALPDGEWASVYSDGLATVHGKRGTMVVRVPLVSADGDGPARQLPARGEVITTLAHADSDTPYADDQVVVVPAPGVSLQGARPDATFSRLGVKRADRLFAGLSPSALDGRLATARAETGLPLLDFTSAYVLHVDKGTVPAAVERLRASPDVLYASPNWTVKTTHTRSVPVTKPAGRAAPTAAPAAATAGAAAATAEGVPSNFALTSSAQSLLNRPGVNAVPAFTALAARGQLPGEGEIITNVSLGDLTDASQAADPNDPCNFFASVFGPTTIVRDGQRFLDWPSMPLIPTYTADAAGNVDGDGSTCNQDPQLVEVGLDFAMMAPLPHDRQRAEATGSGFTDLLGIAPGAQYRLVIPRKPGGVISDVAAAFLAAANQTPRPSVITASLGFALDQFGYASRYLEDDPLLESVLATIVHGFGIVVCVSSGDGLRTFTNAAIAPSGGSVDTDVARGSRQPTDLNDVAFSDAVSLVRDSGAIDVGGSTLNDIFSAPPGDPRNAALKAQQAFPATRYNGGRSYSSGMGERVNVSAPGDNVLSFQHPFGGAANAVQVVLQGGTSASAPEVAAAAAVVLQVARLVGDRELAGRDGTHADPLAVRDFLTKTSSPMPAVPQSDVPVRVGPQVDVANAVETLLARHGEAVAPGVARVAVAQRRQASALGGSIQTDTNPASIPLTGRLRNALITVAPDWTGLPDKGVTYQLSAAAGPGGKLASTPWARVFPAEVLGAAGLPLVSNEPRSVPLTYTASLQGRVLAQATVTLTFGPTDGTVDSAPAPIVDPVVRGSTLRVRYDITGLTSATNPTLVVSHPGRIESATGLFFRTSFTKALTEPTGTVDVPVSALAGGGIYGVGVQDAPGGWFSRNDSAFAFTRVAPTGDARPAVPLVGAAGSRLSHVALLPYRGSLRVQFDVRPVNGADGAVVEISAPGPTTFNSQVTFNNPAGTTRDANGHDTGSVAFVPVKGNHGTVTLDESQLGLAPTMNHVLRVLATRRGEVVGTASGISTVDMNGVQAGDGGSVVNGYGVDERGGGGFLTSNQVTANGSRLGSVETFDEAAATKTVRSAPNVYGTLAGGCAGMFANGVGLYEDFDPATGEDTFRVLRDGADVGTWNPPADAGSPGCAAVNQDTRDAAVLTVENGDKVTFRVLPSDIGAGTFGTPIDLTPALDPAALSTAGGMGQDTVTNQAVVAFNDAQNPFAPGRIVLADLDSGQVSQFPQLSTFFAAGVAVDSTTHRALVPFLDGSAIYDLTTGTGKTLSFGGGTYWHPAVDRGRGLFLMQETAPPDFFGSAPNNNAASAVLVIDEQGNLIRRIEAFNFFNTFLLNAGAYIQVSPTTGSAYTLGPGGAQLHPFEYTAGR